MKPEELSDDLLAIMKIVSEKGGTHCSGSCHHRQPGEFHCHALAQILALSSSGIKERLLGLVRMGLLERHRVERQGDTPVFQFVISPEGKKILAAHST